MVESYEGTSENCTLGLGHERDDMTISLIILVPGHLACLWSRARTGQGGRRWVVEGPHPWVGSTTCATLIDRQPSAWYVGMQGAPSHDNVGGFKISWRRRLWKTCDHPLHISTLRYHWTTTSTSLVNWTCVDKLKLVSSAWSWLMFGFLGPIFNVSFFTLPNHTLHSYQWETSPFPAASIFFHALLLEQGIELIQTTQNKIIIIIIITLNGWKISRHNMLLVFFWMMYLYLTFIISYFK